MGFYGQGFFGRLATASFPLLLFAALPGCARYSPRPIDPPAIRKALTTPSWQQIRVEAETIRHPILKPLAFDERNGLSPDEASIVAVLVNPSLRALRDRRGIAAAQLLQAGLLPDPQFAYSLDVPSGGLTQNTVNAYGYVFDYDVYALMTRSLRVQAARDHAAYVDLDIAWQEWQAAASARLHVYRLAFLEKQMEVAAEEERGLQENLSAVQKAVDAGDMTIINLAAAKAALETTHATRLLIEQQHEQESLALNRSLGFPPDRKVPLEKDIAARALPEPPSYESAIGDMEQRRLDLLALQSGYRSQDARLRAAIRNQFPKIGIGFSQLRDTGDVVTSGFGITVALPFFDRNQGGVALEEASRRQLFDEYAARVFSSRADVARILADMDSLRSQITAAQRSVASLKELVETYHQALLEGNADVLSYYSARNDWFARQLDLLVLKLRMSDNGVALEISTGRYWDRPTAGGAQP